MPYKQITVQEARRIVYQHNDILEPCEYCIKFLKEAEETNAPFVLLNSDDHVALSKDNLEDREATNLKYNL